MPYTYQADVWCDVCGQRIRDEILAKYQLLDCDVCGELHPRDYIGGDCCDDSNRYDNVDDYRARNNIPAETPVLILDFDPEDETTYDSNDFPKQFDAEYQESDGVETCADGSCGGVSTKGAHAGIPYGMFLENRLTTRGYRDLKSMLDEYTPETIPEFALEWADYYQFEFHKNEFESPHDWLDKEISRLAENTLGIGASRLVEMARELARELDNDSIQDLYQSDMDIDDYFKETGWYSPEQ